jgi:uncharacterized membrane protein YraQ (UPF0718 family)
LSLKNSQFEYQKAGVSHGTAHVFLLAAPATNLSTIGALVKCRGDVWAALRSGVAITVCATFCGVAEKLAHKIL